MDTAKIQSEVEFPPFTVPMELNCSERPRAVAIVLPAMGTKAGFYRPFVEELLAHRFSVLSPELPGTGTSHPRPSRKVDYGYRDLFEGYLPEIMNSARKAARGAPVVVIGHSLGAHTAFLALATGSIEADALVTIAGGNIHYRNWSGAAALKIRTAGVLFSLLTRIFGYLPGQYVGFGGPQARTLIREWSGVIRTGKYSHIADISNNFGNTPALFLGIEGDSFAPEKSISALAGIVGGKMEIVPKSWEGNPHSSWARNPVEMVSRIVGWLDEC